MTEQKPGVPPKQNTPTDASVPDVPPLKSRPVLFVVLAIVLAIWLGVLVWMRLKTVDRPAASPVATQPSDRS